MSGRIEERDELLTSLGLLIDPIRRLIFDAEEPKSRIPYVRSQFFQDLEPFREAVTRFCRPGNYRFETELDAILRETRRFADFIELMLHSELVQEAHQKFASRVGRVQDAIRAVPCEEPGQILPSASPYSTYLRLRATFRSAAVRLELFDPYLEEETFHRYLRTIPPGVRVLVVTASKVMDLPPDEAITSSRALRRNRIIAISELLAIQFPDLYEFRVSNEQHDRHIRVDNAIFHLGGSAKDASKNAYFTISQLDPIQSTHAFLDGIIARAHEWYGRSVRSHRRA